MPELGLSGVTLIVDAPPGPTFALAAPVVPDVLVIPVSGPPGKPGDAVIPELIDCGGPNNTTGA